MGDHCLLFLAKSITAGHTDVRTERKRKQFCTGTPALCRLLDGVWNAQDERKVEQGLPDYVLQGEGRRKEGNKTEEVNPI